MVGYSIALANEYLILTGAGIEDVRICKKALVKPFQQCTRISVSPFDFSLNLQAMTVEKLQFALPAVFTIGPDNDMKALKKYALLLSGNPDGSATATKGTIMPTKRNHVQDIVKGIIEGETRVIVSSMTMEEIFKDRLIFKQKVIDSVQQELTQFGLRIYNANVKELQDTPGSEYFAFLSRKAHEGASNQAKVDVAEARMRGEIGEAEKKGRTKQEVSKIEAETAVLDTRRRGDKAQADAELTNRQTDLDMGIRLAQIRAQRQAESKDAELQKEVEQKKAETELERLRALDVTKSKIAKETAEQRADALFYTETKNADSKVYATKQAAEGSYFHQIRTTEGLCAKQIKETDAEIYAKQKQADAFFYIREKEANAAFYSKQKEAEAACFAKKKEAEGVTAMANAYQSLANVMGGPQGLLQYMMIKDNTFEKLALANAKAVKDMQPKISVWNTGENASGADPSAPLRNIFQTLPPLFQTIQDQTGMTPPNWMVGSMGGQTQNEAQKVVAKTPKVNGTVAR